MKKTAIIFSFNTVKTSKIAYKLKEAFAADEVEMVNAENISGEQFLSFDNYILGVPTWFDGELPNYWDEFMPELEDLNLENKTFALFGLGDQKKYPENFVDGIGIMAAAVKARGGKLVGYTSIEGYEFEASKGVENGKFMGLAIDYENQGSKNKERIGGWVDQLRKEFS